MVFLNKKNIYMLKMFSGKYETKSTEYIIWLKCTLFFLCELRSAYLRGSGCVGQVKFKVFYAKNHE